MSSTTGCPLWRYVLLLLFWDWHGKCWKGFYKAEALLRPRGNVHWQSSRIFRLLESTQPITTDARTINKAILSAFTPANVSIANMENLRVYLEANAQHMNQVNAVTLMHRCQRHKQPLFTFLTRERLLQLLKSGTLSAQGISNTLYSTHQFIKEQRWDHNYNEQETEIVDMKFVDKLFHIVSESLSSSAEIFDSQAISNSLYGLRGIGIHSYDYINSDTSSGRPLLAVLTQLLAKIDQSVEASEKYSMSAKGIGNSVFGFQSLSADDIPIVRQLISRFTKYVRGCHQRLDGQAIASIMIGLRSSSANCREVNELIEAVVNDMVQQCHGDTGSRSNKKMILKSKEISMILCGLQSTKFSNENVQLLINTTLSIARKRRIWLSTGDEIVAALTGLRHIGSNDSASRAAIKYIIDSLQRLQQRHHHRLNEQKRGDQHVNKSDHNNQHQLQPSITQSQIASSIYAMQSMTTESPETRMLLHIFTRAHIIGDWKERHFEEANIAKIIYGLQSMTCSPTGARDKAVRATIQMILSKLDKTLPLNFSGKHIAMMTYGLKCMTSNAKEVRGLLSSLRAMLTQTSLSLPSLNKARGTYDRITNQDFASILYGLQGMHSMEPSVRSYLRAVLSRLISANDDEQQEHMSGQEIGMACFGLRLMSNYWPVVQSCILEIASRIDVARVKGQVLMDAGEISMALNGLQSMRGRGSRRSPVSFNENTNGSSSDDKKIAAHGDGFQIVEGLGIVSTRPKWVVLDEEEENWIPVSATATDYESMDDDKLTRGYDRNIQINERFETVRGQEKSIDSLRTLLRSLYEVMKVRKNALSFEQAASGLYGLKGMSTHGMEGEEVELIMWTLLEDIKTALLSSKREKTVMINSRSVSAAFFGLQRMNCEGDIVEELLIQLAYAIELVPEINGQLIGNVLLGMQKMNPDSSMAVRMVLRSLTAQIERSEGRINMTGQNFGNALYGMKSMSSNSKEVRGMLSAIASLLKTSSAEMNGQNIGNALYGLQRMDENQVEVKLILSALAHQIMTTTSKLSGLDIGMSLYGLRAMASSKSSGPEVTVLFGLLIHRIKMDPTLELKLGELSLAIIGVLRTSPWIRDDFLSTLASKTRGMEFIAGTKNLVVDTE